MIDLPMMGATGIPDATSYYPPAPSQSVGGLGGLGGKAVNFLNSGDGSDIIRAVGMSLMSSPGNHWLRDMGTHYSALRGDRRANEKEARSLAEQQQARDALVAFGVPQLQTPFGFINPAMIDAARRGFTPGLGFPDAPGLTGHEWGGWTDGSGFGSRGYAESISPGATAAIDAGKGGLY